MAITETVPFNFDELYSNLSTKFETAGYDTAEGSNVSQLVTAMAYFTSMLNVNTAVNINETLLPLATQRDNALADARALGYEVHHKQSYTYNLEITLSGATDNSYTVPKYSVFTEGGKTYYYMGAQIDESADTIITIPVIEGTLYKYGDHPDTLSVDTIMVENNAGQLVPQYYIDIPFVDVEENGIECLVTYYDDFGNLVTNEEWTKSKQFMIDEDLVIANQFFRMDDIGYRTPRIYFELGGVGSGIRLGSTVNLNILKTSGSLGAMTDPSTLTGISHSLNNTVTGATYTVTKVTLQTEGAEEETLASIKENAPKFYNSANRAVTTSDYQAISNRQASVKDSYVWGGEEELPKSPGHIFFSFLPSTLERTFVSNIFNQEYLLDNPTFTAWDYDPAVAPKALPTDPDGPYELQLAAAESFYSLRFIEDSEIKATEVNDSGELIQPGVWDVIDGFKIPTLEFHNRHPIYLDFEYDIEVLKYDVVTSKADIHQGIFDVVDGFFTGTNDTFIAEKFKTDYFHSSLEKRIDRYLTDATGYNNTISTKLLLTQKNVSNENSNTDYKDVYIPLAAPFESYFDTAGFLQYETLPSIDTLDFIDTRTPAEITAGKLTPRIYTDWSSIQAEITAGTIQSSKPIITVPIRVSTSETVTVVGAAITLLDYGIYPDDPSVIDTDPTQIIPWPFTKTVVTHVAVGGAETVLTYGAGAGGYVVDPSVDAKAVTLGTALIAGESVRVETEIQAGSYILFNSFKKYITVQLYIDSYQFNTGQAASNIVYDTPKSYLTTSDMLYDFTIDSYYLTTDGYSLTSQAQVDVLTGTIIKAVTPSTYTSSPIKMELFRNDRYLNLNYNSPNFAVQRNVIPRLKRLTFTEG